MKKIIVILLVVLSIGCREINDPLPENSYQNIPDAPANVEIYNEMGEEVIISFTFVAEAEWYEILLLDWEGNLVEGFTTEATEINIGVLEPGYYSIAVYSCNSEGKSYSPATRYFLILNLSDYVPSAPDWSRIKAGSERIRVEWSTSWWGDEDLLTRIDVATDYEFVNIVDFKECGGTSGVEIFEGLSAGTYYIRMLSKNSYGWGEPYIIDSSFDVYEIFVNFTIEDLDTENVDGYTRTREVFLNGSFSNANRVTIWEDSTKNNQLAWFYGSASSFDFVLPDVDSKYEIYVEVEDGIGVVEYLSKESEIILDRIAPRGGSFSVLINGEAPVVRTTYVDSIITVAISETSEAYKHNIGKYTIASSGGFDIVSSNRSGILMRGEAKAYALSDGFYGGMGYYYFEDEAGNVTLWDELH